MATIWKFPVPLYGPDRRVTDRPVIDMPEGAQLLTLQLQVEQPTLWAKVDPGRPKVARQFVIVGTGRPIPSDAGGYVGSWQWSGFVWHLFEGA